MSTQVQTPSTDHAPAPELMTVKLDELKVGAVLRAPIFDGRNDKNQLLLSAGSELTVGQLAALSRRGVTQVRIHKYEYSRIIKQGDVPRVPAPRTSQRAAPRSVESRPAARKPAQTTFRCERDSYINQLQRPAESARNSQTAAKFERAYEEQHETTSALFDEFAQSGRVNVPQIEDIAVEQLRQLATDIDEFLARGVRPVSSDYPSRHSLQTTMLATSVGAIMGLRKDELVELNFGCLLHDAGMLLVPQHLHLCRGPLSVSDRLEVQKHPMYALDRLSRCNNVSHAAKMVVYQMHERMNGSGYPRQRQGAQIHPFARIAAVADTYLAMVSPRPYRPGIEPYAAMEKLLLATRNGLFDPLAVRALLHTVSLFPIGSRVQLSDGRIGQVIRSNRENFAKPVVEIMDLTGSLPRVETVDLATTPELSVISTIAAPPSSN
jgi:HD-GYP domain-containing protein (c-di-GMP phosphodiesterase class II)